MRTPTMASSAVDKYSTNFWPSKSIGPSATSRTFSSIWSAMLLFFLASEEVIVGVREKREDRVQARGPKELRCPFENQCSP